MPATPQALRPPTIDELEQALAHALRFDGRKAFKVSGENDGEDHGSALGRATAPVWICRDEGAASAEPPGTCLWAGHRGQAADFAYSLKVGAGNPGLRLGNRKLSFFHGTGEDACVRQGIDLASARGQTFSIIS